MSDYQNLDPDNIYLLKLNNDTSLVAQCSDLDPYTEVNTFVMPFRVVETFHGTGMKQYLFPWVHGSDTNLVVLHSMDIMAITPASANLVRRYLQTVLSYVTHNDVPSTVESDFAQDSEETFEQYLQRQNRFNN